MRVPSQGDLQRFRNWLHEVQKGHTNTTKRDHQGLAASTIYNSCLLEEFDLEFRILQPNESIRQIWFH
jgi:hypothetical protein